MADQPEVNVRLISTGYLHAMRIPLIHGRDFDDHDSPDSPGAILISQSLAKKFWPNEDPVGQHVTMYFFPNRTREVVGIVGDVKDEGLGAKEPEPMIYMPLGQLEPGSTAAWRSFPLWIVARAKDEPSPLISSLRNVIHQVNPALPIADATRMEEFVDSSLSQQRFNMLLLAGFAGIALFLAAIGIYSVLAYNVRRRTREIGIRMALGAQTSNVIRLIFAEAMRPTMLGVAIGVAGALALGRSVSSLIYGVKATDLTTFSAVSLVLVAVSVVASLLPAYRATRVQPVRTLREE
ncbi:MAG: ABC transporter permease [Acidobacteria bacterium]|nr:ABC transporter permease [Acidobacteriota bacterium]